MGMKCPRCHFENPENSLFCGNCKAPKKLTVIKKLPDPLSLNY